jgi:2-polyprenyl-6-hydroxyphenyl methylase/3-demethylubiquinone-9 3-methyltransferase
MQRGGNPEPSAREPRVYSHPERLQGGSDYLRLLCARVREILQAARSCPLCGERQGREVWREEGYRYLSCSRCGLVFSDLSADHYVAVQHNVWNEVTNDPGVAPFYGTARDHAHSEFLRKNRARPGDRLLDVGCGLGFFASRALEAGWDVLGCEPSPTWAGQAQARIGSGRVLQGTADDPALNDLRFDLITAWDVVEHVFDPVPFLVRLRGLLAPGGRLFLRTPNFAYVWPVYGLRKKVLRHDVKLGPTNHVVYFSASTMRAALARAGLSAIDWSTLPPPQVSVTRKPTEASTGEDHPSVLLKNAFAGFAGWLGRSTSGRLVLGADLDVLSTPSASRSASRDTRRRPTRYS